MGGLRGMPALYTWIMLEYCDRGILSHAIEDGVFTIDGSVLTGAPGMAAILSAAVDIAAGMDYLHDAGVVHGDLTTRNVLLMNRPEGGEPPGFSCKVSDFGLARLVEVDHPTTATVGCVSAMPVEVLASGIVSKAADVYAMGVLLWEVYTGRQAWSGMTVVQVVAHKMTKGAQLEFPPGTPPAYEALSRSCMHEDPKQRPAMQEVMTQLEQLREACRRGELPQPPSRMPAAHPNRDPQQAIAQIRTALQH